MATIDEIGALFGDDNRTGGGSEWDRNLPALVNVDKARQDLAAYVDLVDNMSKIMDEIVVKDDETDTVCLEIGQSASKLANKLKAHKVVLFSQIKNVLEYKDYVDDRIRNWTKKLDEIKDASKQKHKRWYAAQEQKRREEEAAAIKAHEEYQKEITNREKKMQERALADGIVLPDRPPVELPAPIIPTTTRTKRTDIGTVSMVEKWTYRVEDMEKVSDRYILISIKESILMEDIKQGLRESPGLKIFRNDEVRFG